MNDFGGAVRNEEDFEAAIIGVPFDEKSSYMRGPAGGPAAIRAASSGAAINSWTELGVDLKTDIKLADRGDIDTDGDFRTVFSRIEAEVREVLKKGAVPLVLGGDHSISYPVVKAMAEKYASLDILHFDAHPDLYPDYAGDPYSHACSFTRIMEDRLARKIIQVGIRAATPQLKAAAVEFGIEMIEMKDFRENIKMNFKRPLYISFDIDALDPAFAPGVSHCEPGGLSTRQVINVIHALRANIVGMDMVEVNPLKDVSGITASAAVKILMEVMGKVIMNKKANQQEGKLY